MWGQLIEQVGPPPRDGAWVHVMDRGADDFEVYCRARRMGPIGSVGSRAGTAGCAMRPDTRGPCPTSWRRPAAGGYTLALRARPRQPARRAHIEVAFAPVTTLVPRHPAASLRALAPRPIAQWVVWVREMNPPPGVKEPIDWVLLTSLPVRDLDEAMEVIGIMRRGG